jgi:hypothetical protein
METTLTPPELPVVVVRYRRSEAMPMIVVYASTGTFGDPHALAEALATELMTIE